MRHFLLFCALTATPALGAAQGEPLRVPARVDTLANGLTLIIHEDHSVPIVTTNVWFHVGSGDEKPGRTGFAHLFEHLMFMGSQNAPYPQFDRLLEAAGANNNGSTTEDRTNYYEDGPVSALPLMLWLEAALFPPTHPYSWPVIGSMADLSAASLEDVKDFFRRYYAPNNATLVVAGDVKPDDVRALVTKFFSDIPRGPAIDRPAPASFTVKDTAIVLEDRVQLPRLYLNWHTVKGWHADDAALEIASYVLAGSRTSRLTQALVYSGEIATSVRAYQDGKRLDGDFSIVTTARPGRGLDTLRTVVDAELARLARDGPTARELDEAKNSIEASFLRGIQQVGGKADRLNAYFYQTGNPDSFQADLDRYKAVSAADVQRIVRQYLLTSRVMASVVPLGKLELAAKKAVIQ